MPRVLDSFATFERHEGHQDGRATENGMYLNPEETAMATTSMRTLSWIGGILLFACGVAEPQTIIRIEAEDMSRSGFRTESVSSASNGVVINLKGPATAGSATTLFGGVSGSFDIFVGYHDESDGIAQLSVSIGGVLMDRWDLNASLGGSQPQAKNFLIRQVASEYSVTNGELIELGALQGNWDNANIDYIEFVPTGTGGTPNLPNQPIVVDFAAGEPVIIDEVGYYVLDRDWTLDGFSSERPSLEIIADHVTFDLRGFTINFDGCPGGIVVTGNESTIRNGSLSSRCDETVVDVRGSNAKIDGMRVDPSSFSYGVVLGGPSGRLTNSVLLSSDDASAVYVSGSNSTIQSNQFNVDSGAISFGYSGEARSVQVLDNVIACGHHNCILVRGNKHTIARNTVTRMQNESVITVEGDNNLILDNSIPAVDSNDPAISINGTRNIVRGNIVAPPDEVIDDDDDSAWAIGIVFIQDGNYYGDNLISAIVPFALGGTVQIDLGGNVDISPFRQ